MGEQRLHHALAPIDLLTRLELEQVMNAKLDAFTRDFYRGKFFIEQNGQCNPQEGFDTSGATVFTIPGPDSGYTWSVKILSVTVSAAATVNMYLGDSSVTAPVGTQILTAAGAAIFIFTSNVCPIKDQRAITVTTSAGTLGVYKVIAQQVPTEMEGKL